MSGFTKPSLVLPKAEKDATTSSERLFVPLSSVAPTEIMNGSLAGG